MNASEKLSILKKDLQLLTSANDSYLETLLSLSAGAIKREGITLQENNVEHDMAVVQYAAYLFRKRAAPETEMPRFLRWQLNNILMSQKGAGNDV